MVVKLPEDVATLADARAGHVGPQLSARHLEIGEVRIPGDDERIERRLRDKIDKRSTEHTFIQTRYGVGYKLDPQLKRQYSGSPTGQGAVYEWEGNKQVGKGRMEITESLPPSKVAIKLDFFKPFEAHNTAEFTMQPRGGETAVTWAMLGHKPFLVIADHLSRHGFAVLRVDDRGVGGSTGKNSASTSDDFAGDVLAEVRLPVEEPHRHQRQPQVGGALEVIPRQDAQAPRIDGERFVDAELRREIGDAVSPSD